MTVDEQFAYLTKGCADVIRRDELRKKLEKDHKISQDEHHTRGDVLQKMTDAHVKDIDTALHAKEQEIMQV